MRTLLFFLFLAIFPTLENARAGLINVNFTSTSGTAAAFDGNGALGGGIWNRIQAASGVGEDAGDLVDLKDHTGTTLPVTLTAARSGVVAGASAANGNALQSQSWIGNAVDALIFVDIAGLVPGQVYRVAVYSNRIGSGAPSDLYLLGEQEIELDNPGEQATALPGEEGVDYVVFQTTASTSGTITLIAEAVAALQIEGRLTTSEKAPALDAMITRNPAAVSGTGQGVRSPTVDDSQTLTQRAKGKRAISFYPIVNNDGGFIDRQTLLLSHGKRELRVILVDQQTARNATAAARTGTYALTLDGGESRRFLMKLKPLRDNRSTLAASLCARPSTGDTTLSDCVAGEIKFSKRR